MSEAAGGFASAVMADVIARANETLREAVIAFRERIIHELNVYVTECAWMKSRGEEPSELNIQDVENAIMIDNHPGDDGVVSWTLRIRQEFQISLDSGQGSALWMVMQNARNKGGS